MTDILIRGMEMPTHCNDCPVGAARYGECYCLIQTEEENLKARTIPELKRNCPLVPLPEGHGRLGDLDALINELQKFFDKREKDAIFSGDRTVSVTWNDAIYHIISAPTIVPAEGGIK